MLVPHRSLRYCSFTQYRLQLASNVFAHNWSPKSSRAAPSDNNSHISILLENLYILVALKLDDATVQLYVVCNLFHECVRHRYAGRCTESIPPTQNFKLWNAVWINSNMFFVKLLFFLNKHPSRVYWNHVAASTWLEYEETQSTADESNADMCLWWMFCASQQHSKMLPCSKKISCSVNLVACVTVCTSLCVYQNSVQNHSRNGSANSVWVFSE